MQTEMKSSDRTDLAPLLIFGLIVACYANTFNAPWYFDDLLRIVNNTAIHITHLSPTEILKSAYYHTNQPGSSGIFHRPVTMITFGLNWFFYGDDTTGYHVVNLLIHFLSALVLYRTLKALLQSSSHSYRDDERIQFIALVATVLWALHPMQIQAVTYIVQRSTSLGALFFLTAIYLYIVGRQPSNRRRQIIYFAGCAGCYTLALGTKLNTALLPASLLLVEILFFQDLETPGVRKRIVWLTLGGSAILLFGCICFLWAWKGNPIEYLERTYQGRPFTLSERLLTQPRVILFYLSQLLWPLPGRFSLVHEIQVSTSLFSPWTTIPSLISVVALIGIGLGAIRRHRYVALAVLFFFANHLVESTIIPLEMVFEHRNYLPTMFVFVPVAIVLRNGIDAGQKRSGFWKGLLVAMMVVAIVALGAVTHSRNRVWGNKRLFWEDALVKAPKTARPYLQLAAYYETHNNLPLAFKLYKHSLGLYDPASKRASALALTNMGTLLRRWQQTEPAIEHFDRALEIFPEHEIARYNLIAALISEGEYKQAFPHTQILLEQNPTHPYYLNVAGLTRLQMGFPQEAREFFERSIAQKPDDVNTLINLGVTLTRLGQMAEAAGMLERAKRLDPKNLKPRLCLIDLCLKSGQLSAADDYVRKLIYQIPLGIIAELFTGPAKDTILYDMNIVRPFVAGHLMDTQTEFLISP